MDLRTIRDMRELVIEYIASEWRCGHDEFELWRIDGLERNCIDGREVFQYKNKTYKICRDCDIRPLLRELSNTELLACYIGQLCQKFR